MWYMTDAPNTQHEERKKKVTHNQEKTVNRKRTRNGPDAIIKQNFKTTMRNIY